MNQEVPTEEKPFLSIVLAIGNYHYLAPLTLDSIIEQTEKDYEIIVVETGSSKHDLHMIKEYSESIKRVFSTTSSNLAHMYNRGLALASGEYVQFLCPGDVYLSHDSLAHAIGQINEQKKPDLFLTSFLRRNGLAQAEVVHRNCSIDLLKRGKIPTKLASAFFKKDLLLNLKGFSKDFSRRESFDLFCRIMTSDHPRIGLYKRIVMDYEMQKRSPKEILLYIYETLKILNRQFGWVSTLKWFFIYDHCRTLLWLYRSIVHYFQKSS